jgi:hypothetical protein
VSEYDTFFDGLERSHEGDPLIVPVTYSHIVGEDLKAQRPVSGQLWRSWAPTPVVLGRELAVPALTPSGWKRTFQQALAQRCREHPIESEGHGGHGREEVNGVAPRAKGGMAVAMEGFAGADVLAQHA